MKSRQVEVNEAGQAILLTIRNGRVKPARKAASTRMEEDLSSNTVKANPEGRGAAPVILPMIPSGPARKAKRAENILAAVNRLLRIGTIFWSRSFSNPHAGQFSSIGTDPSSIVTR